MGVPNKAASHGQGPSSGHSTCFGRRTLLRVRRQSGWRTAVSAGLIALAAFVVYRNSFAVPLVFDDLPGIVKNRSIRRLWPLSGPLSPPSGGRTVSGRPVLNLSLAINYALVKGDVRGYHAFNLAIHIFAGLALFGIVRRTCLLASVPDRFARASAPLALVVALIWVVHPLNTESVTYVIQRAESLAGLFLLLTLYCTIRLATSPSPGLWCAGAFLACLLGMGTKEVMVSAPLVVLLYDRAFLAGSFRRAWRNRWKLYVPLAATWGLLAWLATATGSRSGTAGPATGITPWQYARTQFGVVLHYLRLAFWPGELCLDYWWPVADTAAEILPGAVVIALLLAATVWALVRRPKWAMPGVLFFLALAPTSTIMPIMDLAAERRMYLPLAGVATLVVVGAYAILAKLSRDVRALGAVSAPVKAAAAAALVIVAALGWRTVVRNRDYRSVEGIWRVTAKSSPRNPRAHDNLAVGLSELGRFDDAIDHHEEAIRLDPDYTLAYYNLAAVYIRMADAAKKTDQGKMREYLGDAERQLRLAVQHQSNYTAAHYNLASVLARLGRYDEAIVHYEEALRLNPRLPRHDLERARLLRDRRK